MYNVFLILASIVTKLYTQFLKFQNNVEIGTNTKVYYRSVIFNKSKEGGGIKIGKDCIIGRSAIGYHAGMPFYTALLNDGNGSHITIGDRCRLNGVYVHARNSIVIGNNCVFASGISIIDSNAHELYSKDRTIGCDTSKPISIGNNVWIGLNSMIQQ